MDLIEDFDGSSGDLGGDLQSLEERGLLRAHTRVLRWQLHVARSNRTCLRRGSLKSSYFDEEFRITEFDKGFYCAFILGS